MEAIVCTPYSKTSPKSQINQEFAQLKTIERGSWQKLGVRPMKQSKRNKILFVHEQVEKIYIYIIKNIIWKLRKLNNGSTDGITFLFHWTLGIAGIRFHICSI